MKHFLALLALSATLSAQTWVQNPGNGFYYALTQPMTWHAAEAQAKTWGGHLVTIRSKAEHDWLWKQFAAEVWIGYSDAAQEGTWVWTSGETSSYTNWASGQPDNAGNTEHYAHLWAQRGGAWNDDDASSTLRRGLVEVRARASYTVFGSGCAGSATPPSLKAAAAPRVGKLLSLEIGNLKPGTGGVLIVGNSDQSWNGAPLPLDLAFFGMPQCQLLVSWITEVGIFSTTGGTLKWNATLPNDPGLFGRGFYNQVWVLDGSANPRGIATSNGARAVIGL